MFAIIKTKSINDGNPTVVQGYSVHTISTLAREAMVAGDLTRDEFMALNEGISNGTGIVSLNNIHEAMGRFYMQEGLLAEMLPVGDDAAVCCIDATNLLRWVIARTHYYHLITDDVVDDFVTTDAIYASKWHFDSRAQLYYRVYDVESTVVDASLL